MIAFDQVIGHKGALTFFSGVLERGALSHAYLLVGPAHVGKRHVANILAAAILGVPVERLYTCPDLTIVEREKNEKTGKTKKHLDVDQIRRLRESISRHAFLNGYKVAIVDGADALNQSAANALLKTLEEPSAKTVLFLLAENDEALPATIRSRSQTCYLQPVATSDMAADPRLAGEEDIIALAHGLPGLAIRWKENPDTFTAYMSEIIRFERMFGASFAAKLAAVEELFGDKTDHIAARGNLVRILSIWQLALRKQFLQEGNLSGGQYIVLMKKLRDAVHYLPQNIHPRLLVEHILLYIP